MPLSHADADAAVALLCRAYLSDVPVSKWSTWSVDPGLNEWDGAGNVVIGTYAMGKRVAYQA